MRECTAQPMLAPGIHARFTQAIEELTDHAAVSTLARGGDAQGGNRAQGALFSLDAADFMSHESLQREVFGPSSLLVKVRDMAQLGLLIHSLEGQLTATVLFDEEDAEAVAAVLPHLERKVGRIIGNGWPTGVEVCHAMVHGGPYPATTDVRTSAVGSLAMQRFLRPVCYQGLPDSLLPLALRSENPLQIRQRVDGAAALR